MPWRTANRYTRSIIASPEIKANSNADEGQSFRHKYTTNKTRRLTSAYLVMYTESLCIFYMPEEEGWNWIHLCIQFEQTTKRSLIILKRLIRLNVRKMSIDSNIIILNFIAKAAEWSILGRKDVRSGWTNVRELDEGRMLNRCNLGRPVRRLFMTSSVTAVWQQYKIR